MSGYYMDVEHSDLQNGSNVWQWQFNGGAANQRWRFRRLLSTDMITVDNVTLNHSSDTVNPQTSIKVDNKQLTLNKDYTIKINSDVIQGQGTVTVTGINDYCGSISKSFTITVLSTLGDADGDGEIGSIDVTQVMRAVAHISTGIDNDIIMNADVDGNGVLEIIDATYIQRHLAKMETPYPIGESK